MQWQVQHIEEGNKGVFFIGKPNARLAELTYTYAGNRRITVDALRLTNYVQHTNIDKVLVEHYVKFVRSKQLVSIPIDMNALSVFNRYPQLGDVLIAR